MLSRHLHIVFVAGVLVVTAGCMPEAKAPVVEGPVSSSAASKLLGDIRRSNGDKFSVTHKYKETEFTANWELGNALKKSSQLQIKPPADWDQTDVFLALEIVLQDHKTKPWYGNLDDTVLRLFREALQDNENRATGYAPETPYDIAVKVKQHTTEWFVEVKVQILDDEGRALGF